MIYKGYAIEEENDLWAIKYGSKFKFYHQSGEVIHSATSIEEAMERIDEGVNDTYNSDGESWSGGFADNH